MCIRTAMGMTCLAVTAVAAADVIEVPGDVETIQEAIVVANEGDEIVVAAGAHAGPIDLMGKAVVLRSAEGPSVTCIEGVGGDSVVTCNSGEGPATVLRGFCITGGTSLSGAGMRNVGSSPTIMDCIFLDNQAKLGGGMTNEQQASPIVINCLFTGNTAEEFGGGMHNSVTSDPVVVNCTFSGNSAAAGGGIASALLCSPVVTNCIVWGNAGLPPVFDDGSSFSVINYTDLEGGAPGTGNLSVDPLFVDPAAGDYGLQFGSPAVDAGNNEALPFEVTLDLAGHPRFMDDPMVSDTGLGGPPIIDLGAFERGVLGDVNGDGAVDQGDLDVVLEAWGPCPDPPDPCPGDVTGDGIVNVNDLAGILVLWNR